MWLTWHGSTSSRQTKLTTNWTWAYKSARKVKANSWVNQIVFEIQKQTFCKTLKHNFRVSWMWTHLVLVFASETLNKLLPWKLEPSNLSLSMSFHKLTRFISISAQRGLQTCHSFFLSSFTSVSQLIFFLKLKKFASSITESFWTLIRYLKDCHWIIKSSCWSCIYFYFEALYNEHAQNSNMIERMYLGKRFFWIFMAKDSIMFQMVKGVQTIASSGPS